MEPSASRAVEDQPDSGENGTKPPKSSERDIHSDAATQDVQSLIGSNDAKDKTQVAATTSMAVIHVGILKAILDLGPKGLSYYNWCLGFVITALILQFISGLIAIYIATMKSFLSQFKYDFNYFCKRLLCPCMYKPPSRLHATYTGTGTDEEPGETSSLVAAEDTNQSGCCLSCQSSDEHHDFSFEEVLIGTYVDWTNKNLWMKLETANIAEDIQTAEETITALQEERSKALADNGDPADPRIQEMDKKIAKQQRHLQNLKATELESHSLERKGAVITNQLKTLMNQKVMKKAAFWQCVLTILTYIIFALNTTITGFGLANLASSSQ